MSESKPRNAESVFLELMGECDRLADHDPDRAKERFRWLLEREWDRYGDLAVEFVVDRLLSIYVEGSEDTPR